MRKKTDDVLAPGGKRPASTVHAVAPGQVVRRSRHGSYEVSQSTDRTADLALTPGGFRPKSEVHAVPRGARLDAVGGRQRIVDSSRKVIADLGAVSRLRRGRPFLPGQIARRLTSSVVPTTNGWVTYGSWSNNTGRPVTRFSTVWVVPPAPSTDSGQTIFLFNGIQNSGNIYQPVLQWGPSAAGGGSFWTVASWYVGANAFHSNLVRVNTGDTLTGVMTLASQSAAGFSYNCEFQGIADTGLPIMNIEELTWCVETLECYGINNCSEYPDSNKTAMAAIDLQTGATRPSVVWTVNNAVNDCGQHTQLFDNDVVANGEVDLWYHGSPFWTSGLATIAPGESQEWWFAWGGNGDVGPQLIQAEPLNGSAKLSTTQISERQDPGGNLVYFATVHNDGPNTVGFQWRGGGR